MTSNVGGNRRILGSLRAADGTGIVRIEDRFDTDVDDLWSALTDPARLALWLGEVEGDLRVGGEFRARFFASGWEGTGRVEACEPPNRFLVLTRDADEPDGANDNAIEARLTSDGQGTILVWEERGMPVDLLAAYGAGIQIQVEDLAAHIAGKERADDAKARWDAIFPAYQDLAAGVGS
jgi:uncharacterized protein YndB with AHSA1/START domain